MSLQMTVDCPCRRCPWKMRSECDHYRKVCLEIRSCARCEQGLERCIKEGSC